MESQMSHKTQSQALAELPADAKWTSSFGCPGEGGYVEYFRDAAGNRYTIDNGRWCDFGDVWTFKKLEA
jgi:hypothetical protein